MNIIHSGDRWQVYGDALEAFNILPVGTYNINFNPMSGFYLTKRAELAANEERIYGVIPTKVKKVIKSYYAMNRNLGVLLSGKKGIGKSLFARALAEEGYKHNLPVIVVDAYYSGIAAFLSSIEQDVIILFDEFEKIFLSDEDVRPQDEMLSLFDGLDGGHKLFVITCNEVNQLSSYMRNRPGRFHYHIELSAPTGDEIREYLTDKLKPEYHSEIQEVVALSQAIDLPYDYLRAIAFELNQGYTLKETLADLNISRSEMTLFNLLVYRKDGSVWEAHNEFIDFSEDESDLFRVYKVGDPTQSRSLWFNPQEAQVVNNEYVINTEIHMSHYTDSGNPASDNERENTFERIILQKASPISYKFV